MPLKFLHRVAGLGSLGKERFTGIGTWLGGQIAREAKALTVSACHWAEGRKDAGRIYYELILQEAVRCPDPLVRVRGNWLIRRLSPDCFRIRLMALPKRRDEQQLLYSMGWETANIHLGSAKPDSLTRQLKRKTEGWLHRAAKIMRAETMRDWKHWAKDDFNLQIPGTNLQILRQLFLLLEFGASMELLDYLNGNSTISTSLSSFAFRKISRVPISFASFRT